MRESEVGFGLNGIGEEKLGDEMGEREKLKYSFAMTITFISGKADIKKITFGLSFSFHALTV